MSRVRVPPCRHHLKARFALSRKMPATPCRAAAVPSAPGGPRPQRSRVPAIVLRNNNKDVITILFYPKRARVTKSAPSHSALKPVQTAVQRPNMVSRCGRAPHFSCRVDRGWGMQCLARLVRSEPPGVGDKNAFSVRFFDGIRVPCDIGDQLQAPSQPS